jgi:hypothetical protein
MSARHRHHKRKIREVEDELDENASLQAAIELVMAHALESDRGGGALYPLGVMLAELRRDRAALIVVMEVLAPNEWMWRIKERWREARQ